MYPELVEDFCGYASRIEADFPDIDTSVNTATSDYAALKTAGDRDHIHIMVHEGGEHIAVRLAVTARGGGGKRGRNDNSSVEVAWKEEKPGGAG